MARCCSQASRPIVEMNTTPLIDVMLVLLIMLIITIPIQTPRREDRPSATLCELVRSSIPSRTRSRSPDAGADPAGTATPVTGEPELRYELARSRAGCPSTGASSAAGRPRRATRSSMKCSPIIKREHITQVRLRRQRGLRLLPSAARQLLALARRAMPLLAAMSDQRRFAVVILAAGQGTRMRSDTHKVLHPIASRPLLLHLLDRVDALGADKRVVVVGKGREQVEAAIAGRDVDDRAPGRAEGHRPRRPAGRGRARRLRRAGPDPLWRHAVRRGGDAAADARPARRRRRAGRGRARLMPGRSR